MTRLCLTHCGEAVACSNDTVVCMQPWVAQSRLPNELAPARFRKLEALCCHTSRIWQLLLWPARPVTWPICCSCLRHAPSGPPRWSQCLDKVSMNLTKVSESCTHGTWSPWRPDRSCCIYSHVSGGLYVSLGRSNSECNARDMQGSSYAQLLIGHPAAEHAQHSLSELGISTADASPDEH